MAPLRPDDGTQAGPSPEQPAGPSPRRDDIAGPVVIPAFVPPTTGGADAGRNARGARGSASHGHGRPSGRRRATDRDAETLATSRVELQDWVREHLHLPPNQERAVVDSLEALLARFERRWQDARDDAIAAVSDTWGERLERLGEELSARNAAVSNMTEYFERLVADLTERAYRDPKTPLMNFSRFMDQVERFLTEEQPGRWCALGLVDIRNFKSYNDTFGHALGDRIIRRVAELLREQVRSGDIVSFEFASAGTTQELHARFGGDEFCFLVPNLNDCHAALVIAERFRVAVERYDWATEDVRLAERPVRVDIGVACLLLGPVAERRPVARQLAEDLLALADSLMYKAKRDQAPHAYPLHVKVVDGRLAEVPVAEIT